MIRQAKPNMKGPVHVAFGQVSCYENRKGREN